jgi:hypothetical protein
MMKTLKIVIGLSLGLVVIALMANPKSDSSVQDASPTDEESSSVAESASPGLEATGSAAASAPAATVSATPSPVASGSGFSAAGADRAVSLRGGIFGSVLSSVADWKEGDLREAAEKTGETPRALRQFSAEMAERMSEVWKDAATQEAAFSQLALCARTMSLASPVRALCAANAKRLSLNDSAKFQSRFEELEKDVAPEIREFLAQVKQAR